MEKIVIKTSDSLSEILIGEEWENVSKLLPKHGVVIITDQNVHKYYSTKFPDFPVLIIQPGEESKRFEVVVKLSERLIEEGIDRNGFILGIGGGVVCDIAGFLASIYMRGIRCGYVSSTLLSQVDASTGGKNGINLGDTKNILGCFKQPEFVICDPTMLQTLSDEEYFSGLSELIKTGIIGDSRLFETVENNHEGLLKRDPELLSGLITKAVNFKASIVSQDEKESGVRRILNFGHTFGHAIELLTSMRHGYAVASGMELASRFSLEKGYITAGDHERIVSILKSFNLLCDYSITDKQVSQLILHDKKRSGSDIYFVFIKGIGRASAEKIPVSKAVEFYLNCRNEK